jgi:hypothetical protein
MFMNKKTPGRKFILVRILGGLVILIWTLLFVIVTPAWFPLWAAFLVVTLASFWLDLSTFRLGPQD